MADAHSISICVCIHIDMMCVCVCMRVCVNECVSMCMGVRIYWLTPSNINCTYELFFPLYSQDSSWWRHQMETFSALLAICAGNSPVIGEFPAQRPVTRCFDDFFHLRPNKWLNKQWWGWWFETPSHPLWRHCNLLFEVCSGIYSWSTILSVSKAKWLMRSHWFLPHIQCIFGSLNNQARVLIMRNRINFPQRTLRIFCFGRLSCVIFVNSNAFSSLI